jgi:hypothetical protein
MKLGRGSAMGLLHMGLLHRVFSADQLKDLDLKDLEILKSAIANVISTDDDILDILKSRLQSVLDTLKLPPTQSPPPP